MTRARRISQGLWALRKLRLLAFALLPLLYLPLRAAEPPREPSRTEQPAERADDSTAAPSTADAAPAGAPQPAAPTTAASAATADDDEAEEQPLERVSADNNLSFPVDI
jgi:hypothetical protein